MSNMEYQEKLEELTSGSNWVNGRTESVVTVLFVTNENVSPKFAEANPPQVVFLTQRGAVISVEVDKFIKAHDFYNVQPELERVLELVRSGNYMEALEAQEELEESSISIEDDDEEVSEDELESQADERIYGAKLARDIDIQFMTVEGDTRREPLMTDDLLRPLLLRVSATPIVVHRDDTGLAMVGSTYVLTFQNNDPNLAELISSAFDPESVCKHYAGFTIDGRLVEIDTVLGLYTEQNRAGSVLNLHLASLDVDDASGDQEEEQQEEQVEDEKPKSFTDLAAELHRAREEAARATTEQPATTENANQEADNSQPEAKDDSEGGGDNPPVGGLDVTVS